jgi:C4-dicarboxylate-specific signal transduction histidine kinase
MPNIATTHHPDELARVEQLLEHFEQLEQQLQQVRDSLTHSHRLATLGTIASIIAHEYNNILTPMISYAQLALAKGDDPELMRKAVEKSLAGAQKAATISSSLLGFAQEADERHAARVPAVLDETLACLGRDLKQDGITLTLDLPNVQVAMSPLNLQQVLLNLILNARQAMVGRGGSLHVTGRLDAGMVYLEITDTGPGIPEAIRGRMFEPFVTQRPTDQKGNGADRKGTGLGLCICRDLVRQAGGMIDFTTATDKGTTFYISVPKADDLFENEN